MHDDQQLDLIEDAFTAFRADGPLGSPLGADAVRVTVRRRRRVRLVAAGALAVILLVAPIAAYASGIVGTRVRPQVGNSTEPAPSPSTSESPAQTSGSTPPSAPDGRVTPDQLAHATVDFGPKTPQEELCPSGTFTFSGNPTAGKGLARAISIAKIVDVDFDHDGALESVALIGCALQGTDYTVLALDRAADGSIVTVGTVVSTSSGSTIQAMFDIRADSDGAVGVQVGDRGVCCSTTEDMVEHQWRGYAFDGARFNQVGGPTKFTAVPEPNDLAVTVSGDLVLGAPSGGARHGSLTATVHNNGPKTAPGAIIEITIAAQQGLPAQIQIATDLNDCSRSSHTSPGVPRWTLSCHLYPFAVGESRSYTFRFTSPVSDDAAIRADAGAQFPKLTVSASVTEEQPGIRVLEDHENSNDSVTGRIRLAS